MKDPIRIQGTVVALLRKKHMQFSRQKTLAHEVGISVRTMRKIEKGNDPWDIDLAKRIACALGSHWEDIVFSAAGPKLVPSPVFAPPPASVYRLFRGKQLYPRFGKESAKLIGSAGNLFESVDRAHIIIVEFHVELNPELAGYADELIALTREASRETRGWLGKIEEFRAVEIRQRMKWLLIQLKGNDVLVFVCDHTKYLPESDEVMPDGQYGDFQWQGIVAFAPPQEWDETSVEVDVDHGQPYIIDWDKPIICPKPAQPTG
jgi:DNA-binding XRE family transcriptional regulator